VAVEWWRICLDEAQMVECVTTKTAEMALALKAVNRWCVTGTPLMRSVEDIYGLLLFLGVDPLLVQQWFRLLVWEPFCHGFSAPMHHALSRVLWRTAKKDVIDQIDLPDQSEEINWLTFSPVEEHFYRRQYEMYLRNAYANRKKAQNVTDPTTRLHSLDRKTMNELLSPLFRLRQACCHPQIVRGEFLPLNKSMMTMEELLEHMTKKVKTECEEAHRQIVASLNGMSGLAILRGKIPEAIDKYRDVLRSVEEHKDQFRTDELQQLHAMHNLAEMLDKKPAGVFPTLRDSSLKEQVKASKAI
jgi:E3 ubiquitin-protein ligase SHPRH